MRQQQFLLYSRWGDIELGRREGTEEGAYGGGGGGEGRGEVGWLGRKSESMCETLTKCHKSHMIQHGRDRMEKAWEERGKIEELHVICPADKHNTVGDGLALARLTVRKLSNGFLKPQTTSVQYFLNTFNGIKHPWHLPIILLFKKLL